MLLSYDSDCNTKDTFGVVVPIPGVPARYVLIPIKRPWSPITLNDLTSSVEYLSDSTKTEGVSPIAYPNPGLTTCIEVTIPLVTLETAVALLNTGSE